MTITISEKLQKKLALECLERFKKVPHVIVSEMELKSYEKQGQSFQSHNFIFKFFADDFRFIGQVTENQYQRKIEKLREGVST